MPMEGFSNQEPVPPPIPNDAQEPFLFDLPNNPDDITLSHYQMLDKRYGGILDEYERNGKIKDKIFQGSLWIEIYNRTKDEIPQWLLERYLHEMRGYKFSKFGKSAPWSTTKVIKKADKVMSSHVAQSTINPPTTPPMITNKDLAANDHSLEEE